jgi:hypothetical protein
LRDKRIIVLLFSYFLVDMRHKTMLKSAVSHHLMGVGRPNPFCSGLKLRLGLLFLIGALLFVACSRSDKDPIGEEIPVIPDVPAVFSSGLLDWSVSSAANGSWDEGDQMGVYMIPHVAEAPAAADFSIYAETASNVPYLTSGSGESVALVVVSGQKAIVFPTDGSPVNFVAYSPYKAGTNTANGHVYKVDVSNQSPAKAIDLLYHKGIGTAYSKTNKNVTLGFTHQLSKMKISLVPASGTEADLTGAALTLTGFPATADFNLSTGVLSNLGGADKSIIPVKDAASSADRAVFEAIVVPHTGDSYTRNVSFKVNGTDYTCPLPVSAAFKAGVAHSYNFKFTGTKVEPAQELVSSTDGNTVSWGDYQLKIDKLSFDLAAIRTTGNPVTLSTNAPAALTYVLSNNADSNTDNVPEWMTGVSLSDPTPGEGGWNSYILTFDTEYNINSEAAPRTGYIRLEVAGITLPVRVTQAADALYIREPMPASFPDLPVGGATGNTFTITTNAQDEEIAVNCPTWITKQTPSRSEVAADGTSTWTISFDVTENTTTDARSGNIEVTIGGVTKIVSVSQVGVYVNEPSIVSFPDLPVGGATGNTFTITTNAQDEEIAVNCPTWITKQTPARSEVAADGTSTWTIGFDVTENTTTDTRSGNIEVTIGGVTKIVSVSQITVSQITIAAPSNCYIVAPGTEIYIPVSRANEHDPNAIGANDVLTAELVWTDTEDLLAEWTTHDTGSIGAIKVKASAGKSGNAVVAVKVDDVIKWSWHIWVTAYDPTANLWDPHSAGGTTTQDVRFMDRNLGAMEAANSLAGRGLHYQWGRKDPFPTVDNLIVFADGPISLETAIRNPSTFYMPDRDSYSKDWLSPQDNDLWGGVTDKKTIYDPCPAGFRVPLSGEGTASPWSGLLEQLFSESNNAGYTWGTSPTSYWPAAGCRDYRNGTLDDLGRAGLYWTATVEGANANHLTFVSDGYLFYLYGYTPRAISFSVRCGASQNDSLYGKRNV